MNYVHSFLKKKEKDLLEEQTSLKGKEDRAHGMWQSVLGQVDDNRDKLYQIQSALEDMEDAD